jgi:4-amino-4-deoxy-L-arabinose transferase-like glycosyltransferase
LEPSSADPGKPDIPDPDPAVVEGDVVDTRPDDSASRSADAELSTVATKAQALRAGVSWWVGLVALVILALIAFLPGWTTLPPIDRDESRFAQASRQMLASGDLIVPMIQDRPRLNKPPLIYWLQSASAGLFTLGQPIHDAIWMYRVPSILAAIAAVLLTWKLGSAMFESRTARLAAAMLAICPLMIWEAKQARADMVLLAITTATMLALWRIYALALTDPGARPWKLPMVFWALLAASILVKGPITPMIAGLTAVGVSILTRRWGWIVRLRPILGLLIIITLVGPWVFAVVQRIGWSEYTRLILDETLGRSASAKEGHWGPPGYHTLLLPVLFWPGSMLTAAGIALAWRRARETRNAHPSADSPASTHTDRPSPDAFLLAWILPSWLVFELVSTKLPHYTMPMLPAIALLSARAVLAADAQLLGFGTTRFERLGQRIWLVIGLGVAIALPIAALVSAWSDLGTFRTLFILILIALAMLYLSQAAKAVVKRQAPRAQLAGAVAMLIASWALVGLLLPAWSKIWITPRFNQQLAAIDPLGTRPIAAISYQEDSLIFQSRGRIERLDASLTQPWLQSHPTGLVIVDDAALNSSPRLRSVGSLSGFNYSKGRSVTLHIAELAP